MRKIYKAYQSFLGTDNLFRSYCRDHVETTGQAASDLLLSKILDDQPLMVSRLGSTELSCIINYHFINKNLAGNVANVLNGFPYFLKFNKSVKEKMTIWSGFYPSTEENLRKFAELSLNNCLPEIDILASWMSHEKFILDYCKYGHSRIFLDDLDSFRHKNPWTLGLKGKKVLVIHPFQESIEEQYKKREYLFKDQRVLPEFELITLKAVQTLGGESDESYGDWFNALDSMIKIIDQSNFDVALIGAGAYGMPLAAHIKKIGKKAIHIGGSLQCLFGIKGARWEAPVYGYDKKYYNEYWVRPLEIEKPKTASLVEGACYW